VSPDLRINVEPEMAEVRFVGVDGVFDVSEGGLDLMVQPGDYDVRITAPQYSEKQVSLTVGGSELSPINIELQPALVGLGIRTEPGAEISLVGEGDLEVKLGMADANGRFYLVREALDETFRLIVRKQGYVPALLGDLRGELLMAPLVELPASLTVYTRPAGAQILVDGRAVGHSPVTVDVPDGSGDYTVVAHHQGYRPTERVVYLDSGEHEELDFGALAVRSAKLDFEVTFEGCSEAESLLMLQELEVQLNDQRHSYNADALEGVPEGTHMVRLLHPRYVSDLQAVTVSDQMDQTLTVMLRPLPGQIELELPAGLNAEVRVDGVSVDVTSDVIPVIANRRVELELRIRDYLTMLRRFKVKPDERIVWKVDPVRIPGPEVDSDWVMPYLALKFAWINKGSFSMGSPMQEAGRLPNEGPQTAIEFSRGFWAGVYEVTYGQYSKVLDLPPPAAKREALPVDNVSWAEAKLFCEILTNQERTSGRLPSGYVYRLPTEAEWEYLARSGTASPFAFGQVADASSGNFRGVYPEGHGESWTAPDHYGSLPVGSYQPNRLGLYDVHGNVAEWTLDRYNGRLPGGSRVDPRPREDGRHVAVRGGSWEDFSVRVRCAARDEMRPDTKSDAIGFRVVLAPRF
jgi:formylglycine-generating enzyme required for sulfatase activity